MSSGLEKSKLRLTGMRRTSSWEDRILRRIRAARSELRVVNWSDRELRESVGGLDDESASSNSIPEDTLVRVFAVVDETIRRRLGLWNVFKLPDTDDDPSIAAARRELDATGRGRYPGSDLLLSAEFYRAARRRRVADPSELHFRPTDQQLLAGLHLYNGRIVEMVAGEGKTVAAAFPAALYGLTGRTVHVVTANDYLAARDCELLAPVFQALGLTVGAVLDQMAGPERRGSYAHRIIYGTLREFAFDYLRDRLVMSPDEQIQGPLDAIIIDEADQTLLDEAVTPLVIAGSPVLSRRTIIRAGLAVRELVAEQTRLADECRDELERRVEGGQADDKSAMLLARIMLSRPDAAATRRLAAAHPRLRRRALSWMDADGSGPAPPEGRRGLALRSGCGEQQLEPVDRGRSLPGSSPRQLVLRRCCGRRFKSPAGGSALQPGQPGASTAAGPSVIAPGVEYVVDDDRVVLVDRDTGRPRPDTHYQDGLHPAVEAKEGVPIHPDHRNLGEISVPGFVRRYRSVAGLTGTAQAAADEFRRLYGLDVAMIPEARRGSVKHSGRRDLPSRVYAHAADQLSAVVDEVRHCQKSGRPTLVATRTVSQSEAISQLLTKADISHRLLNAATGQEEGDIVRAAGQPGAVTVATNMAGRGTDVILPTGLDQIVLEKFVALLEQLLLDDPKGRAVGVRANTPAEANLLEQAVRATPLLSARRPANDRLTVRLVGATPAPEVAATLEFGLGLHLVCTEFNDSPRVALQLQGRSGRQGAFGSTRNILVRSDRWLTGLEYTRPAANPAGRVCWEGPGLERQLRRRREAAQQEAANARALLLEYAAVLDDYGDAYYRARQEALVAGPDHLARWANDAARILATVLASGHFPGLVADDYPERFAALAANLLARYGIDAEPVRGCPLDVLDEALAELLRERLTERRERLGAARYGELARLLLLQAGDELWENHRAKLRGMAAASRLEARTPKTAIAEYVIDARDAWHRFREDLSDRFLSQMLHFPTGGLTVSSQGEAPLSSPLAVDPRLAELVS